MILLIILIIELLALYILSRRVTQAVYTLLLIIFRTRTIALPILLVLEFPGTVVHELAHLFTAGILGVRTGKLSLEPENIRDEHVKAGSVAIAETDPFRKYAIGLAPIVWGLVILTAIAYFLPDLASKGEALTGSPFWKNPSFYLLLGAGYFMFAISNTMFSSSTDLSGFAPFALVLSIFLAIFYFLGLRITLTGSMLTVAVQILTTLTKSLAVVIGINAGLLAVTWVITAVIMKLLRVRVI
jgi:hypothetical protein